MADKKISELTAIGTIVDADLFAIVDVSATETKKATVLQIKTAMGVVIPATEIAYGNGSGDGITSGSGFKYNSATGGFTIRAVDYIFPSSFKNRLLENEGCLPI